jgi:sulfur-oxidizing protein SoxZ
MASTIRVRATASGETTEVQALIQHPMDSGFVKDAKGDLIPPHFIQQLTFEHDGKNVFVADWGTAVSKDPYVKFSFKGGKKDDDLKISWVDNKGASDTTTAKIL